MSGLAGDTNPFADPNVVLAQSGSNQNPPAAPAPVATGPPPAYSNEYVLPPPMQPSGMSSTPYGSAQPQIQPQVQPQFQAQPFGGTAVPPPGAEQGSMYQVSLNQKPYATTPALNQDELDRRANELEARERELNRMQNIQVQQKNFPPLPSFCPWKPCFYHAIDVEIPVASQKNCKIMFYIWQFYVLSLLCNSISAFALLVGGSADANTAGTTFGVSLVFTILFTPCSWMLWYRPIYKALRDDSSFNYMLFFFIMLFQIVVVFIYALGIPSFGAIGWINALSQTAKGNGGVGALMIISSLMWTLLGLAMVFFYRKIHATYRTSGASFEKAQSEFAAGVASNKTVQNVAVESMRAGIQQGISSQQQPR